jgi:hypothetical protein
MRRSDPDLGDHDERRHLRHAQLVPLARSTCSAPPGDAQAASYYDPVGATRCKAPYVAGVFHDAETADNPEPHYQSLLDGFGRQP